MGRFAFAAPGGFGGKPWRRIGDFDVTTPVIVVALCVASMFLRATSLDAWSWLVLLPDEESTGTLPGNGVLGGEVWRLVTWPFANQASIWVVITLVVFWYFGSQVEALMGRRRFLWFLGLLTVLPGIVGTLLDLPQAGIRPVEFGVFLVFIAEYPFMRFLFGIPAWILGLVFLGIEVLQLVGDRRNEELIFLFVTLGVAAVTARAFGLINSLPWVPKVPLPSERPKPAPWNTGRPPGPSDSGRSSWKPTKRPPRGGGEVVQGPWSSDRSGPLPMPPPPGADTGDAAELDDLLDKINATGIDSLSNAEKQRLNELSKRLRDRGTR